jgi:hypothetical protein
MTLRVLLILLLFVGPCLGANVYIRAGQSGSGASWSDALGTIPGSLTRGNTYYVADGTYSQNLSITAAATTEWTYIKKATTSDHGTETGWSSTYGDGVAEINGYVWIDANYIEFNGQVGSGTSGHGFKIYPSSPSVTPLTFELNRTNIRLLHTEVRNTYSANYNVDGLYLYSGTKNIYVAYCWVHDVPRNGITIAAVNGTSWSDYGALFEYNFISETGGATDPDIHGQTWQISYSATNNYIIYNGNTIRNPMGTAVWAFLGYGTHRNHRIYNNLIYITNTTTYNTLSPGVVYGHFVSGTTINGIYFYNNSLYNLSAAGARGIIDIETVGATNVELKNNIWENCWLPGGHYGVTSYANNGYYNNSAYNGAGETGVVTGTSTTFTTPGSNFTLKSGGYAVNTGTSLSTIFTTDITGATRSGTWDIGAYDDGTSGGGDTTPPTVSITGPTSSATYSTTSTTINISGTASDNVGVTSVTWSNYRGGSGTATGTTSWSQNSVQLYLGSNVLTVRAYDAAGLYSEDTLTVTLTDSTAPTVTIQTSSPQAISSDSLQVSFTSNDNIAVTETRWRIGAQPNGSTGTVCTSPATTSGYNVGANTLWIGARDASGNWGYNSITVNYTPASDGVAPTVTITTTKPAEIVADSMTLTWTDSDNVGVTERRWLVDAQPTASTGTVATSPAIVTAIRVGTQTVWVGVRDAAGNWSYDSIQVTRNYGADRKGVVLSGGGSF